MIVAIAKAEKIRSDMFSPAQELEWRHSETSATARVVHRRDSLLYPAVVGVKCRFKIVAGRVVPVRHKAVDYVGGLRKGRRI